MEKLVSFELHLPQRFCSLEFEDELKEWYWNLMRNKVSLRFDIVEREIRNRHLTTQSGVQHYNWGLSSVLAEGIMGRQKTYSFFMSSEVKMRRKDKKDYLVVDTFLKQLGKEPWIQCHTVEFLRTNSNQYAFCTDEYDATVIERELLENIAGKSKNEVEAEEKLPILSGNAKRIELVEPDIQTIRMILAKNIDHVANKDYDIDETIQRQMPNLFLEDWEKFRRHKNEWIPKLKKLDFHNDEKVERMAQKFVESVLSDYAEFTFVELVVNVPHLLLKVSPSEVTYLEYETLYGTDLDNLDDVFHKNPEKHMKKFHDLFLSLEQFVHTPSEKRQWNMWPLEAQYFIQEIYSYLLNLKQSFMICIWQRYDIKELLEWSKEINTVREQEKNAKSLLKESTKRVEDLRKQGKFTHSQLCDMESVEEICGLQKIYDLKKKENERLYKKAVGVENLFP